MFELLLEPAALPFSVALGLMLAIALIEVVSLVLGMGLSSALESMLPEVDLPDADIELDGGDAVDGVSSPGLFAHFAAWLCIGRVPALIVLIAFLTAFGLSGLVVQHLALGLGGAVLPVLVAVAAALLLSLPLTRYLALGFAWVMPQEESEAVEEAEFLGKVAVVIRGTARAGQPAEAKLADRFGKVHYLLVEPAAGAPELPAGARALLLQRQGAAYLVMNADAAEAEGVEGLQSGA